MAADQGPVVLLTGANRGIGYYMLVNLVGRGYRVAALDIDGDNVREVAERAGGRVRFHECDVAEEAAVTDTIDAVIDRWDRIDILVNNAAIASVGTFHERSLDDLGREIDTNLMGYANTIHAVLPRMLDRGSGIIHNMGSGTGDLGHPGLAGYAATKGAIKALAFSLRLELRNSGVTATLMVPPSTNTRMTADLNYPGWMTVEPEPVGRKLADKIESTDRVITPDRRTKIGLAMMRRVPGLWRRLTARVLEPMQ